MSLATSSLERPSLTHRVGIFPGKILTASNRDRQKRNFEVHAACLGHLLAILAQESRRVTIRLKTGLSGSESISSTTK